MRKLICLFMVLSLILIGSISFADPGKAKLTVYAESAETEIYVDNVLISKGVSASLDNVDAGKHYIKGVLNGATIFSELVEIKENDANTILIKTAEAKPKEEPAKTKSIEEYLTPASNNFKRYSIGFEVGWPFYGINLQYWPVREHGLGINYYSSSSSYSTQHLSFKYKYRLSNQSYLALAAGTYSDKRYDYGYYSSSMASYSESLLGAFFGIIMSDSTTFEFGYGHKTGNDGESGGMVTFSTGIHYLF